MKKKVSPVQVVIGLILLLGVCGALTMVLRRYMPTGQTVDGADYFGLSEEGESALVVDHVLTGEKVKVIDGRSYISQSAAASYINSRFYWDSENGQMLYSLPTETIRILPDNTYYTNTEGDQDVGYVILRTVDDTMYLDMEFVNAYTDMEYVVYEDPDRVVVRTDWDAQQIVTASSDAKLRQKGGIKSSIVTEVSAGDVLYLQESMDTWSQVSTADGYTGYIENDKISESSTEEVTHVSTAPEYTNISKDYRINLAWHQVTSTDGNALLASVTEHAAGLTTISPTWFSVTDNDGTISSLADANYVNEAHQKGLEVWALIDNFSSSADTLTVLSSTEARANIISQLMEQAAAVGLDGINLDFESITEEQAPHYIQFIRELSIACRNAGLVFSIDDPVPTYSMHYDRKEQGIVADYVIIMGYDEHYSGDTEAGSVASLGFVRSGIEDTLQEVPAQKVINGIPFYTRLWIEPFNGGNLTSEVYGMDGAAAYISENNITTYWDEDAGQNVGYLEGSDAIYSIWLEDADSVAAKMQVIQEHELAGVAEWKLGFESDAIWSVISEYLQY